MGRKKYTQPYKDLDKLLRDAGFTHRFTGTGHHQYKPPPGSGMSIVVWATTPGSRRSRQNTEADVRRAMRIDNLPAHRVR